MRKRAPRGRVTCQTGDGYTLPSQQPLALRPIEALGKATLETIEQFVDLGFVDHERRAQRNAVAQQRPDDDALVLGEFADRRGDSLGGWKARSGLLVRHQFDSADQSDAGSLAYERMLAELRQPGKKTRRHMAHMAHNVALLIDFDGLERHRRGDGMAGIGEAMAERADPARFVG